MDILQTYNDIAEATDRALKNTAELIRQTDVYKRMGPALSTAKGVGGTLFQGALGPGLMITDQFAAFAKGEATFAKAATDFVKDAKQLELGGKITARGIEEVGTKWLQTNERIARGAKGFGTVIREWTNTSKQMGDTIEALAGKTDALSTSFRGLARVVKISTGTLATTLIVAHTAYSQFVKKWMDDSEKLEESLKTTSNLFKDGSLFEARTAMNRASTQGTSRQEFISQLQGLRPFAQNVSVSDAARAIEVARITARELGTTQTEQLRILGEHISALRLGGADTEAIRKDLLRQRVMAGGPTAGLQLINPYTRYQEWGQDVGRNLNATFRSLSPSEMYRQWAFTQPGDTMERLRGGIVGGANRLIGNIPIPIAPSPLAPSMSIGSIGDAIRGFMGAMPLSRATSEYGNAQEYFRRAGIRGESSDLGYQESARRLNYLGGMSLMSSAQTYLEGSQGRREGKIGELEKKIEDLGKGITAAEVIGEGREGLPKAAELMKGAYEKFKKAKIAEESGNIEDATEGLKEFHQDLEDMTGKLGKGMDELMQLVKTYDDWSHALPKDINKAKDELESAEKELEKHRNLAEEAQKTVGALKSKSSLGLAGMTYKQIGDLTSGQIEEMLIGREEEKSKLKADIRELRGKKVLGYSDTERLKQARERLEEMHVEETGFTPAQQKEYMKYVNAGETEKAEAYAKKYMQSGALQLATSSLGEKEQELITQQRKFGLETSRVTLPVSIATLQARGMISAERADEISAIGEKGIGTHEIAKMQMEIMREQTRFATEIQKIENEFVRPKRALQGKQIGTQTASLLESGGIESYQAVAIQSLTEKGDEKSLYRAQQLLEMASQRKQIEDQILQTQMKGIEREGSRSSIGLDVARLGGMGIKGLDAVRESMSGSPRVFDQAQGVIKNIISIQEQMYQKEIQFTVEYTRARQQIIETHYNNLNQIEKGRLEQYDRKYAPQQQYGQTIAGTYQTIAGAQMGRYAGEDYRREQGRTELDMKLGFAGMQLPRGIQMARQLGDFRRAKARQKESDELGISGAENTWGAIGNLPGVNMDEFGQSEGGRNLRLQLLQQNQAAYSRRGIDVSGQIKGLAQEQQVQAGKKLAVDLQMRRNQGASIEEQIKLQETAIAGLKPGDQQDRASVQLAETYQKAAQHYNAIGEPDKAAEYMGKQEEAMAKLPPQLKKDFGDTQAKSLNELTTQTQLLTSINAALGGKAVGAVGDLETGVESDPEATGKTGGKDGKSKPVDKFGEIVDKFGQIIDKPIKIVVNGQQASSSGGAGSYS